MFKRIIAWDLGATKCAAGIIEYNTNTAALVCQKQCAIKLSDATSFADLNQRIEQLLGMRMQDADAMCIGAAGQYDGNVLQLDNGYPYLMNVAQVAKQFNWPVFDVIHDYAPLVCATFTSYMTNPANIKRLNSCEILPHGRRVAFGIGTGLGLKDGVLLSNGNFWLGHNEMGHIGVTTPPSANKDVIARHFELEKFMRSSQVESLTFEKILSGQGLVRLHKFLYGENPNLTPEEVGQQMHAGSTPELTALFAWYSGLFVAAIQLIFMPQGGIWISGGVALTHLQVFDHPDFQAGIEATPAYYDLRKEYPLGVLINPEHALIGGGFYAASMLDLKTAAA